MYSTTYVLSNQPLSRAFQGRLETTLNSSPIYISVSDLRRHSIGTALRTLFAIKEDSIVITGEDETLRAVLPVLQLLSGVSRARSIQLVTPELVQTRVSRTETARAALGVASASVRNRMAMLRSRRDATELLRLPRLQVGKTGSKRVLYLNANLWFGVNTGGAISHISGVANALQQMEWPVTYAAMSDNHLLKTDIKKALLQTPKHLGIPATSNHYYFDRFAEKQLLKRFGNQQFGFLYQRLSIANYTGVKLSRAFRLPLILEYNGSEAGLQRQYGKPIENYETALIAEDVCFRHAHLIVTISEPLKEELLARGVEESRIVCYPNGIDPSRFDVSLPSDARQKILRKLNIPESAIVFCAASTFAKWHGMQFLADSIRHLANTDRQWIEKNRVHFLFVGDGPHRAATEQALASVGVKEFCTFAGLVKQSEGPAYLAAADVLMSPHLRNEDGSKFIGSPIKLFEYMASGKAIIASDLDQLGEVLKNSIRATPAGVAQASPGGGDLAVLVEPGNMDQLIRAIRFLTENRGLREELGINARAEALSRYTWKRHTTEILQRAQELDLI